MAERGYAVHSNRHCNAKLSGCTVLKFYSQDLNEAESAFSREAELAKTNNDDVYLIHCEDIMQHSMFDGRVLRRIINC